MNSLTRPNVMFQLQDEFKKEKILTKEFVEHVTGLSEKSICHAYFAETGKWLVKVDPNEIPSRMSKIRHVSYIRVKDMDLNQTLSFKKHLRKWREGVTRNADDLIEALDDHLDSFSQ